MPPKRSGNPTPAQSAAARENGKLGGRPTNALTELKRKARERAQKLIAGEQEESVRFLIWVRDDPRVDIGTRVTCAKELLNRGEIPAKSITAVGAATPEGSIEAPKLFVIGKFGAHDEEVAPSTNGHADDPAA